MIIRATQRKMISKPVTGTLVGWSGVPSTAHPNGTVHAPALDAPQSLESALPRDQNLLQSQSWQRVWAIFLKKVSPK